PVHAPDWQLSDCVHGFASSQAVPLGLLGFEQAPVVGSHVPASWHWSSAVQVTGLAPPQTPAMQASVCVHEFPSSQAVPSALAGLEQTPVVGSHVPASWHWSAAVQVTGLVPLHSPVRQASVCVHASPSSQGAPSPRLPIEQLPVP